MKERLDLLIVDKHLVEGRAKAKWLIKEGFVSVDGKIVRKPGKLIREQSNIILIKEYPYVGRGGLKLEAALKKFSINTDGKICADIGASIGGFTDCLLNHGVKKVYAIDIAVDLLHPSLLCKSQKVIKLLGIDARRLNQLPELVDLVTIDITFASLKSVLPNLQYLMKEQADVIVLIKPLFETDFYKLNKFNVIVDSEILVKILEDLIEWCYSKKIYIKDLMKSPLSGKRGSLEFLAHFKLKQLPIIDYKAILNKVLK